jgi:histidinol-phosphate aminotransferase
MAPYHPPTGGRQGKLRLDFNENTVGCSPKVVEYLKQSLTADALTVYPEYVDAMRELAAYFAVAPGELLLSNGTDEAIQLLINTFVDDSDDVLMHKPSYLCISSTRNWLAQASARSPPDDLSFPLEEFMAAIRPATSDSDCESQQPDRDRNQSGGDPRIRRCAASSRLLDEAYFEFCGVTALPLVRQYPNLFVSRTFSKVFGMAAFDAGACSHRSSCSLDAQGAIAV